RSFLTLLGIVIGVFTVVAMMALLDGLQRSLNKTMGQLGAGVFQIQKWPNFNFGPLSADILARKKITVAQALALRDALPEAKQVGPELWEQGKEMSARGLIDQGVQVAGGTPEFFTNTNLSIAAGRTYNEGEALDGARVAVIGAAVADALFPGQDPSGERGRLGGAGPTRAGDAGAAGRHPAGRKPGQRGRHPHLAVRRDLRDLALRQHQRDGQGTARHGQAAGPRGRRVPAHPRPLDRAGE